MTISNTSVRKAGPSQGNGVNTAFPFTFKVFTTADVLVTYLNSSGVELSLALNTDYTVSLNADQNASPGGTVTLLWIPAVGTYITLISQLANTQNLLLTNSGGFYPNSINDALDRCVIQIQQLAEKISRSLSLNLSSIIPQANLFPIANTVVGFDYSGKLTNFIAQAGASLIDLANPSGSTLVGTIQPGIGAVTRTVASKLNDIVSVKDFGAVGDGVTDDTAAIQAALNSLAAIVLFPQGKYLISSTLLPAADQVLVGVNDTWGPNPTTGSIIYLAPTMNAAGVKFTNRGAIRNFCIQGNSGYTLTSQNLIYVQGSGVVIDSVMLVGGYNNIYIDSTTFYVTINNITNYTAFYSQLNIQGSSGAGVDLILSNSRFLSLPNTATSSMIFNNLGSILATNVQVSSENTVAGGALIHFVQPASSFGGAQFTNCVFESGANTTDCVLIDGTSGSPWPWLYFTSCQINGGLGAAIVANFATGLQVTGGYLGGSASTGTFVIPTGGIVTDFMFVNVNYEGGSGYIPNQCGTTGTISGSFIGCRHTGTYRFVDYSTLPVGSVTRLDVIGGSLGSYAVPVALTQPYAVPGTILTDAAWTQWSPAVSSANGALTSASATGWYKKVGRTIHFIITISITTNGTAATAIYINNIMLSNSASPIVATGRALISGKMVAAWCAAGAVTMDLRNYDGTYPGSNGEVIHISGTYQM